MACPRDTVVHQSWWATNHALDSHAVDFLRYAIRSARSSGFLRPANTILVPVASRVARCEPSRQSHRGATAVCCPAPRQCARLPYGSHVQRHAPGMYFLGLRR
jgi:hypothetical protein